jgi:N-acetylglucosamine-6-phosphate deacetylase
MASTSKDGPFRKAGALEAILASPDITAEVIADGFHVAPELLRLAWHAKGRDGLILITDATAGAGLKPGRLFDVGTGLKARVMKGHALTLDGKALAGSTCTMIEGIATLVRKADVPLADAVRTATFNPARRIGREKEFGSLQEGLLADMVLFDGRFKVRQVWREGRRLL